MGKIINIMIGLPGCGKSTYCKRIKEEWNNIAYISRDEVRLEILGPNEPFFAKETIVYNTFIDRINQALASDANEIYIDATHINSSSRLKLLRRLNLKGDEEICYYIFDVPIEECMRRNRLRTGIARVPDSAIRDMNARAQFFITDAETRSFNPIAYMVDYKGEVE